LIVLGAAGHAAMSRAEDLVETAGTDLYAVGVLATWGNKKLTEIRKRLSTLQRETSRCGVSYLRTGWKLDKWDSNND
jgi:hypothetical protein